MKAAVYEKQGVVKWTDVPDALVRDRTDAVIRVEATTICGTDLHILRGDVPEVPAGLVLGHEAVGTVVDVGLAVRTLRPGDRVLASCITSCGTCGYCRDGRYGQCRGGGGWLLGHRIDGVQAEYARIPFADTSTFVLPERVDVEDAVLLADIFPTAYEVGVLNGRIRPGDTVVIVGAGPVGLAAVATARLFSPGHIIAVDPVGARRDTAKLMGADITAARPVEVMEMVAAVTDDGADVVIEAVGTPEAFELCTTLVRPGGRVANIGVHGSAAPLHLERLWTKDVTITTGLVDGHTTARLLRMLAAGRLDIAHLVSHRFSLHDMEEAYAVFADAGRTGALKVALTS
ncbi:alcohol dehydrogenase [Actinorhabdospora filicis]|uniref:Alcohol dehydrogenase n=1 Tax=Actinorhabdospora filicis TaxID=1785913 RepID=A0A9W6SLS1_9ACTN|nr:alcohol dehydrogenase catalytic domain-containing protein [Actinorhabdospora filicis]GLZ78084.1 alcohol dehydrogenase [Actinorhabdospora filicis]